MQEEDRPKLLTGQSSTLSGRDDDAITGPVPVRRLTCHSLHPGSAIIGGVRSFEADMLHWWKEHLIELGLATVAVAIPVLIIYFVLLA